MSRTSLDIEHGEWFSPREAAKKLPGLRDPKAVRDACLRGELEHFVKPGPNGAPRYFISAAAIRAYIRRGIKKAA